MDPNNNIKMPEIKPEFNTEKNQKDDSPRKNSYEEDNLKYAPPPDVGVLDELPEIQNERVIKI